MEVKVEILKKALSKGRYTLSEHESKKLLIEYDIPVTREIEIADQQKFMKALKEIEFPLVIKACAPQLSHKTERGLVYLDIRNEQEAVSAYKKVMSEIEKNN